MFPSHPFVLDGIKLKTHAPNLAHIFPTLNSRAFDGDVSRWIVDDTHWLDVTPTPIPTAAKSVSKLASPTASTNVEQLPSTSSVAIESARLAFLMSLLKERPIVSTAGIVFTLADTLALPSSSVVALLREHIILLYERGEDTRAWECVPRLEDGVAVASVLIGVGRTRLGLFLHALETKNAQRYAQLVSAVPAAAWQWLAKAQPPLIMSKKVESDSNGKGASYLLSSSPLEPNAGFDPLRLILTRSLTIKQKAHDIDIHATLTLLKRVKSLLDQAVHSGGASSSPSLAAVAVGLDNSNKFDHAQSQLRTTQPLQYARAYAIQLIEIATLVVRGIAMGTR